MLPRTQGTCEWDVSIDKVGNVQLNGRMESELRGHLLKCSSAFAEARKRELTTVGRMVANDGAFFKRIADPKSGFTIKTYDQVMSWFSDNWPEGAAWPADVPRPEPVSAESAA